MFLVTQPSLNYFATDPEVLEQQKYSFNLSDIFLRFGPQTIAILPRFVHEFPANTFNKCESATELNEMANALRIITYSWKLT